MTSPKFIAALALVAAGTAVAHTGVKNETVKARMDGMSAIAAQMKTLGQMAKGAAAFDAETARSAAGAIARHASQTPSLFEEPADDPKSEAKPEIWANFADFTAKSGRLEALAQELTSSISTKDDLAVAMQSLGSACQACHKVYRQEK